MLCSWRFFRFEFRVVITFRVIIKVLDIIASGLQFIIKAVNIPNAKQIQIANLSRTFQVIGSYFSARLGFPYWPFGGRIFADSWTFPPIAHTPENKQ